MLTAALRTPEVSAKFLAQGLEAVRSCGKDLRAHVRRQQQKYERAIQEARIEAD